MDVEEPRFDPEQVVVLLLYSLGMYVEDQSLYSRMVVDENFLAPWLEDEQLEAQGMEVELLYMAGQHC